jgi:hypothetical protein
MEFQKTDFDLSQIQFVSIEFQASLRARVHRRGCKKPWSFENGSPDSNYDVDANLCISNGRTKQVLFVSQGEFGSSIQGWRSTP